MDSYCKCADGPCALIKFQATQHPEGFGPYTPVQQGKAKVASFTLTFVKAHACRAHEVRESLTAQGYKWREVAC